MAAESASDVRIEGATVLITGGTGSLGQALVRRLLQGDAGTPERIVIFSRDEAKQYAMKTGWKHAVAATEDIYFHNFDDLIEFAIGDVRDYAAVHEAVSKADVVVHAAAMKQVPTCEYFPSEAVRTNVLGAEHVVRAARNSERVHTVIGVSTDKACKPVNVMGMSKAIQERVLVEGNLRQERVRMAVVRYGNVISSRGSVVPLFQQQIAAGGPVTITTRKMTRFLLSLDQAVDTVLAAVGHAARGDTLIPRVPAARIVDLAAALIGDRAIETVEIGIRPGEKVHEILVSDEEAARTVERGDLFAIEPMLPELVAPTDAPRPLSGEYSSEHAVIAPDRVPALLAQADYVDPALSG